MNSEILGTSTAAFLAVIGFAIFFLFAAMVNLTTFFVGHVKLLGIGMIGLLTLAAVIVMVLHHATLLSWTPKSS